MAEGPVIQLATARCCYARADGESIMGDYAFIVDDDVAIVEEAEWGGDEIEVIEYAMGLCTERPSSKALFGQASGFLCSPASTHLGLSSARLHGATS